MNLDNEHIDFERLKAYFDGTLSEMDKNSLEMEALDDPFLKDAMDGFAENPAYLNQFEKNFVKKNPFKRKRNIAYRTLTIMSALFIIYFIATLFSPDKKDVIVQNLDTVTSDSIFTVEVEVLPIELETLIVVKKIEQISLDEILEDKIEIQKEVNYDTIHQEEKIVIEENEAFDPDFKLISEIDSKKAERVPATYFFDLYIVDYRRIKREKNSISYTKYELTGTSAELENSNSESTEDLIQKKVDVPYFEYLRVSMDYFKNAYFKKALNRYKTILEQYTDDANALFYGGLCYYNMKKYTKSISFFDQIEAMELNAFKSEAKWYKAKCLIKLGKNVETIKTLDEIIMDGGFYMEDAMELKKSL